MLEPSLHRRRHTVLDVSCRVRLSTGSFVQAMMLVVRKKSKGILPTGLRLSSCLT